MAIRSQFDQRKHVKYTDQHGRKWWAMVELRTGDPCSLIMPTFVAPMIPPQNYLKLDPEIPGKIEIEYDRWERDMIAADKDWVRRCHETGVELYKDAFDVTAPFNVAILNKIGARPRCPKTVTPLRATPLPGAAALPVQAAKAGVFWILGLKGPKGEEPKMPERLHDFFVQAIDAVPVFTNEFEDANEFEATAPEPVAPPAPQETEEALPAFLRSATLSKTVTR